MIQSLYIIDAGLCLYSYKFQQSIAFDDQLLSGFFTAIGNFAQEAFRTGLATIKIRNGLKMNFFLETQHGLVICAVSDERDNDHLLEVIMGEITEKFISQWGAILKTSEKNYIDQFKNFDPVVENLMKNRDKPRNLKTIIQGLLAGVACLISLFVLYMYIYYIIPPEALAVLNGVSVLYISLTLFATGTISGYFAGNPRMGLRNGIIFFVLLIFLIGIVLPAALPTFIAFFPFGLIVCAAAGYYGGRLRDKKKLYPLPSD